MFKAASSCAWRVLSLASGGLGVVIALIGTVLQSLDKTFVAPGWAILAIGTLLLFIAACQIEWELIQEKEKNRKPTPTMKLMDVVKRIRGKDDILGPDASESMMVLGVLTRLREHGANGSVTIFGVKGLQYLPGGSPEHVDNVVVRLPIPKEFWEKNAIGYMEFIKDGIGVTEDTTTTSQPFGTGYGYLWFDKREVDSIWPSPRRKLDWRHPLRFKDAL